MTSRQVKILLSTFVLASCLLFLTVTIVQGQGVQRTFPALNKEPSARPEFFPLGGKNYQSGVGTTSYVQENGRRVYGVLQVGGYTVTVTLKDPTGNVKTSQTVWADSIHYEVNLTTTIRPSDTVEVTVQGSTSSIYVEPMSAHLDSLDDQIVGQGPENESLALELQAQSEYGGYETYTATATTDATGAFTVSTFYDYDGQPRSVDIQPGDAGILRYTREDGNQVYLNFGQVVYVHQGSNEVYGYAAMNSVPVSATLYAGDGTVKAKAGTTSDDWEAGAYWLNFTTEQWGGDPVPIRGGDTVVVVIDGVSTTVPVDPLTASPALDTDTVSGSGPANSTLEVSLDECGGDTAMEEGCSQQVQTDAAGLYSTEVFTYLDDMTWTTRTHDIVAGDRGLVEYINSDFNVIYIDYAAPQVRVQENGRQIDGLLPIGGYTVTVTLKDSEESIKTSRTVWADSVHYNLNLTTTIRPSDTVHVSSAVTMAEVFVSPMSANLDSLNDQITGWGPVTETLALELQAQSEYGGYETYTATATTDATGAFTVSTFYDYDGQPRSVDIQPGDTGTLRYTCEDGNQVYLNFGQVVYVHQNDNEVHGYAAMNSVPVSATLYAGDGTVKAQTGTTSDDWDAGAYWLDFTTEQWGGDPVPIRGGDTVVVIIDGVSTTVPVDSLTANPNLASDTVSGVAPPDAMLKVTLNECGGDMATGEGCSQWVTTTSGIGSLGGLYTTDVFTYMDDMTWTTHTHDIVAGDTGRVEYINADSNVVYIDYAAPQTRIQENGRRIDGLLSVGGYTVTVTLEDSAGSVKTSRTVWADGIHYDVNLTTTIRPSDTVRVSSALTTTGIFVSPISAGLDSFNDQVTGKGPANESMDLELQAQSEYGGYETYEATATTDATGAFTVSTFYDYDGQPRSVDIQPGDTGVLRYTRADGNQIYLHFGQVVYVHQNDNEVHGYAAMNSVPVSATLYAADGSVKAKAGATSDDWGAGAYWLSFTTEQWGGDPVPIRGGDMVIVVIDGVSTTVPVNLLTAVPNLSTDKVVGSGPSASFLEVTLNECGGDAAMGEGCSQQVRTDADGLYTTDVFTYVDEMTWTTRTHDIVAGNTGRVEYINPDFNVIYIDYAATGVATTIAPGGLRAGATAVLGTAVPSATVEIWDVTESRLIGTGTASSDARFAISVDPPLIRGHTIVAIADGLSSVGHVVQAAVTINGPAVTISNTVGLYGIAPAESTVVVYEQGVSTGLVTTTADASGHWGTSTILPAEGTYTLTAKALEPDQDAYPITVIYDPTAVSVGGSSGSVGGETHESDESGQNHFQVVGGVQPVTFTVEVFNNPCTVTIGFMGQIITPTAGTTPDPQITHTVVFTDYEWDWGTHDVVVNAVSCGGTPVSQKVSEVTLIDPSGYVYNAYTGERIKGATVTCHYSSTLKSKWVVWEAALYNNQINPQRTDKDGRYGFMVPAGAYYVTASKPGYADNQTIVYHIPPPVTDAHIPLTPLAGEAATVTLSAEPDSIPVGGATSTLTATIVDEYGTPVADGTIVTFTTDLGELGNPGTLFLPTTTVGGVATVTLTSGEVAGKATLTATADMVSDTTSVAFTPGALDHFGFDVIDDQMVGVPFGIGITAYDAYSNTVTSFTDTVALTDTTGTISPTMSGDFITGEWSEEVEIGAVDTEAVITATHDGVTGVSRPFTVTETLSPPSVPTLLSPPDEHVTTTQAIMLSWQASADADGYHVDLDGEIVTTTETYSPTVLALGVHTWTVQAYNAAGMSDWAAVRSVEVTEHHIYLPLVVRNHGPGG